MSYPHDSLMSQLRSEFPSFLSLSNAPLRAWAISYSSIRLQRTLVLLSPIGWHELNVGVNTTEMGSSLEVWMSGGIRARVGKDGVRVSHPLRHKEGNRTMPLCTNKQSEVQLEDQGPQARAPETVQMQS